MVTRAAKSEREREQTGTERVSMFVCVGGREELEQQKQQQVQARESMPDEREPPPGEKQPRGTEREVPGTELAWMHGQACLRHLTHVTSRTEWGR